jgi:hypothetical protein
MGVVVLLRRGTGVCASTGLPGNPVGIWPFSGGGPRGDFDLFEGVRGVMGGVFDGVRPSVSRSLLAGCVPHCEKPHSLREG